MPHPLPCRLQPPHQPDLTCPLGWTRGRNVGTARLTFQGRLLPPHFQVSKESTGQPVAGAGVGEEKSPQVDPLSPPRPGEEAPSPPEFAFASSSTRGPLVFFLLHLLCQAESIEPEHKPSTRTAASQPLAPLVSPSSAGAHLRALWW